MLYKLYVMMAASNDFFPGYEILEILELSPYYDHFLARDMRRHGLWVRIVSLKPKLARSPELLQAFKNACQTLASIQMDGIQPVLELGHNSDGNIFVSIPILSPTLSLLDISDMRMSGRLAVTPSFFLSVTLDATNILNAAQKRRLDHYSVMPDSIVVAPDGHVSVTRFIEAIMRRHFNLPTNLDDKLNAPEWRRGEEPGVYSDTYAIGAILYRFFTGRPQPDEWEPRWFSMMNDLDRAGLPGESFSALIRFFTSTLAERPSQRINSYAELAEGIHSLLGVLGPYEGAVSRRRLLDGMFEPFPPIAEQTPLILPESLSQTDDTPFPLQNSATGSMPSLFSGNHDEPLDPESTGECLRDLSTSLGDNVRRHSLDATITTTNNSHPNLPRTPRTPQHTPHSRRPVSLVQAAAPLDPIEILAKSRYKILEKLGEGGTGTVYKVLDTTLSEVVALKILKPEFVLDQTWLDRFKTEMRITRDIAHPFILPAYHLELLDGIYLFTMKYVDGKNLAQLLEEKPIALPIALRLLTQTGRGLVAAHDRGIIHRDLKPANIMVERDSFHPWLMDFGIASDNASNPEAMAGIGTPYYMSPEQASSGTISPATDIFSFGVVAYECLTRTLPYMGRTPTAIYTAMCSGLFRPIAEITPDVPHDISEIIEQCLNPDVNKRPGSMRVVLDIFDRYTIA